jgi:CspA family cold shock protein
MITGRIKWFNEFQGYGYIVLIDGTEVYFHGSGIRDTRLMGHLDPGTSVCFDLIQTRGGPEAENVDLIG